MRRVFLSRKSDKFKLYTVIGMLLCCAFIWGFSSTGALAATKSIRLSSKNFPEESLLKAVAAYDKNHNGYISEKELKSITSLNISKYPDYDGEYDEDFRYFTEEEFVFDFKGIDKLVYLESLKLMLVGGETAEGVHYPSETRNFECIYKLSGLKTLHLYSVSVPKIDISRFDKLTTLHLYDNPELTDLTLNKALKSLKLDGLAKLQHFDIPALKYLKKCEISGVSAEYIKFGKCPRLKTLTLCAVTADKLDISKLSNLEKIYFDEGSISNPDFSANKKLQLFSANRTEINKLDLSENSALKEVLLDGKKIKNLVLPKDNIIAAFRWANAGLKQISLADLGLNPEYLEDIILWNNKLTSLDIRGYYKLNDPWIEDRVEIIR